MRPLNLKISMTRKTSFTFTNLTDRLVEKKKIKIKIKIQNDVALIWNFPPKIREPQVRVYRARRNNVLDVWDVITYWSLVTRKTVFAGPEVKSGMSCAMKWRREVVVWTRFQIEEVDEEQVIGRQGGLATGDMVATCIQWSCNTCHIVETLAARYLIIRRISWWN